MAYLRSIGETPTALADATGLSARAIARRVNDANHRAGTDAGTVGGDCGSEVDGGSPSSAADSTPGGPGMVADLQGTVPTDPATVPEPGAPQPDGPDAHLPGGPGPQRRLESSEPGGRSPARSEVQTSTPPGTTRDPGPPNSPSGTVREELSRTGAPPTGAGSGSAGWTVAVADTLF